MKWTSDQIRSLRLRLGWSQADFARRLNLQSAEVSFLEAGLLAPNIFLCSELEIIFRQVEVDSFEKRESALVECRVDDRL